MIERPTVRFVINSQDDVARRKAYKAELSNKVEESLDELGILGPIRPIGRYLKTVGKKILGIDDKRPVSPSSFDEKKHPRGPDGRFAEAPKSGPGSISGLEKKSEKTEGVVKVKEDELYQAQVSQWEADKAAWEAEEVVKLNKKIKAINDGELKKANSELANARRYLKGADLTDAQLEKGTRDFQIAVMKVKAIKAKIFRIKPEAYKVDKPKKKE